MSDIELRQSYKDQLYNYRPSWILRWGVTYFFIFLVIVIGVAGFIRYPDTVPAIAEITTINPPANLIARVNGQIAHILVEDGESVTRNSVLAVLESPTQWEDMLILENYISMLDSIIATRESISMMPNPSFFRNNLVLGEIQMRYAELMLHYIELYNFLFSGLFERERSLLHSRKASQQALLFQLTQRQQLLGAQFELAQREFRRDSVFFERQLISESEFEQEQQRLLQFRSSLVDMEISIVNAMSSIEQLHYELRIIEQRHATDQQTLINRLSQSLHLLKAQIEMWRQNFLIIAPINGMVSFTTFWNVNQNVTAGEIVLSVVPQGDMEVRVRIQFPVQNSGRVEVGQRINIKLHNYPRHEFGMLVGHLSRISAVSNDMLYSADVTLYRGLVTSYGISLPMGQHLIGDAEILTDDVSLLMRFFNPLRALVDRRITN